MEPGAPVTAAAVEKALAALAALLERAAACEEARVVYKTVVETGTSSVVSEAGQFVIEAAQEVTV